MPEPPAPIEPIPGKLVNGAIPTTPATPATPAAPGAVVDPGSAGGIIANEPS